jgi:hypothetical protein
VETIGPTRRSLPQSSTRVVDFYVSQPALPLFRSFRLTVVDAAQCPGPPIYFQGLKNTESRIANHYT